MTLPPHRREAPLRAHRPGRTRYKYYRTLSESEVTTLLGTGEYAPVAFRRLEPNPAGTGEFVPEVPCRLALLQQPGPQASPRQIANFERSQRFAVVPEQFAYLLDAQGLVVAVDLFGKHHIIKSARSKALERRALLEDRLEVDA